ncbi:GDSL-type esterase/lipase family protein [Fibrobacter sp.]|uniref:GDSL-type esterase/lipase family protein n=1 Tax=Fibrobacter sp. TaxID=35828 RepID=UPI0025BC927C|nr:GDSL-type esterase/lipase family protein [Fibrobacter sp.]MBR3072344.1 GDSL family lipase [Fibrobacter sp.]
MKSILKYLLAASVFTGVAVSDSTSFTIHVVGDSTVQTYKDNVYPQTGWGQVIGYFFDGARVKVNNAALGGRSSRTFIEEGRLDGALQSAQKGDFLFVQFGHNDRDYSKAARYVDPKDFPGYIQKYVDAGKKKGVNVILISPMNLNGSRNVFSTGSNNYDARGMMQTVAKNNKIPFVDLNMKSYNTYNNTYKGMGDYVTRYLYKKLEKGEYPNYPDGVNDGTTHFQEMGSMGHAQMICEELEDNLKNNTNLSAEAKTALTTLVSSIKKRYTIKVKTNLSNYNGLITQTQYFPAGSPMTLRVTPNGQTFEKWVDDDCKELSNKMIYYGFKTKARDITYTAMFKGGAACTPIAHGSEESGTANSSSSGGPESSSSVAVTELAEGLCSLDAGTDAWPSVIDMSNPEMGDGWTESNHEGYTGGGFFNLDNSAYSKATYMVTSDQSAEHARMMIRYAFSGSSSRDMKITVDNGTYDVVFPSTGSWDKWDTVYVDNVWVDALDFKVILQSATADGGPNVDMIAFDMKDVYRTGCKAVREKNNQRTSLAAKKPALSPRKSGFTVNALGQKLQNVNNREDLKKLPKGNYFSF